LLFIRTFSGKGVGGVGVKCIMAGLQPPELVQVFIHLLQRVNAHYIHRNAWSMPAPLLSSSASRIQTRNVPYLISFQSCIYGADLLLWSYCIS